MAMHEIRSVVDHVPETVAESTDQLVPPDYKLTYNGKEVIVRFKKPNVGQITDALNEMLNIRTDQPSSRLEVDKYVNKMIISCFDNLPFPATIEGLRSIEDFDFYLSLGVIVNQQIPMQSFFEKMSKMFSSG